MTRILVYSTALVAFVAATALTLFSIFIPSWISYSSPPDLSYSYGLHRACTSTFSGSLATTSELQCRPFPAPKDCQGTEKYFCSVWRTTGFLMNFSALFEVVICVGFVIILMGGKQKREGGWKLLTLMMVIASLIQCAAMGLVAYLFDNDDRFFVGWKLDNSWIFCTVSWSVILLAAGFVGLSAFIFPPEDGYELIPSERQY